jgi:hypothetical protein
VESKSVQLVVEEGSTGLWMREKCRGVIHSIFLNKRDCFWLLESLEELLIASSTEDFWRRSRSGSPGIFVQRCANRHGRFLVVEDFGGGKRRGFILVPEGRSGEGWKSFVLELRAVVNFLKSRTIPKPAQASSVKESKLQAPIPSNRRSFAEVMMQNCPETLHLPKSAMKSMKVPVSLTAQQKNNSVKPFVLMKRPASELPKMPERPPVQPLKAPAKYESKRRPAPKPKPKLPESFLPKIQGSSFPASLSGLGNGADKVDLLRLGRDGSDIASEVNGHPFGENPERVSFRNTLNRLKRDVERCLKWVDSGLCPCVCGLLGPAPKPSVKAHVHQPLPADPVRGGSCKEKKKGLLGLKPKVIFKPILNKRGPLLSGPGPIFKDNMRGPGPIDKGKKVLPSEDTRPIPVENFWVPVPGQASSSMSGSSQKLGTGTGRLAVTATSPPEGVPTAILHRRSVPSPLTSDDYSHGSPLVFRPLPESPCSVLTSLVDPEIFEVAVSGVPAACDTEIELVSLTDDGTLVVSENFAEAVGGVPAVGLNAGIPCDPEGPETVFSPVSSTVGGSSTSSTELPLGAVLGVTHGVVSAVGGSSTSSSELPLGTVLGVTHGVGGSVLGSDFLSLSFPLNTLVLPRVPDSLLISPVEMVSLPLPNPLLTLGQGEDAGLVSAANSPCLEVEVFSEVEPMPLASCPAVKARGSRAARKRTRAGILRLVKNFGHFVGLSCDGYEGKLAALFEDILASNENKAAGSSSSVGKKGMRELNNLFSSINYDSHSGSASFGRSKGRDLKGV